MNSTIIAIVNETLTATSDMNSTNTTNMIPTIPQRSQLQVILGYVLTVVIAITMIGMGCGVDFYKMRGYILRPTGVIIGVICQFVLMPAVAFALAKIVQMNEDETIALLLVGSCPGGTTSNIASYWIRGDMDLSITMTTISTTLGLGMMPLLLFIYSFGFGSNFVVPYQTIGIALATLVVPIVLGMCIRIRNQDLAEKILKVLSVVGSIAILGTILAILLSYGDAIVLTTKQIICAAVFPGIGMLLGYGISSLASLFRPLYLEHRQRRTICIETGVQNTQLAGAIIQLSFSFLQIVRMILFPVAYFLSQLAWLAIILVVARVYFHKHDSAIEPSEYSSESEKYSNTNEKDLKMYENNSYVTQPESDFVKTKI